MAKTCTTEKTSQRQRWIENGLVELMLANKYEDITATDLCRHLNLSRRSFYRYFRDIDDVLDTLMNHTFLDFATPNTILSIEELQTDFDFWLQHKTLLDALAYSGMSSKIPEYALKYADEEAMKEHLVSYDLGMDIRREINLFVISGLASLVVTWHAEGFQKTPEQMAQIAHRLLSSPILKSK